MSSAVVADVDQFPTTIIGAVLVPESSVVSVSLGVVVASSAGMATGVNIGSGKGAGSGASVGSGVISTGGALDVMAGVSVGDSENERVSVALVGIPAVVFVHAVRANNASTNSARHIFICHPPVE